MHQAGTVIAVERDKVWVDVTRQNACNSCSAKNGCGTSLIERALPKGSKVFELAVIDHQFTVGSVVDISMTEDKIVTASLLIYGLPLLSLITGALAGNALEGSDLGAISGAVLGFGVGYLLTRCLDKHMAKDLAPKVVDQALLEVTRSP